MGIRRFGFSTFGRRWAAALVFGAALTASATPAHAFCGFYISGADAKLFNNATMVVMMRDGLRTVLSMQNNYEGPTEDFAMVVPVPVVLQEENVKTLPREVFTHIDQLAAPRLVEYWEQDPCAQDERRPGNFAPSAMAMASASPAKESADAHGVVIEAQFSVGEYNILILSAKDSSGLDAFLRENKYKIPDGAEAVLRPYVEGGMKFFVAKVDATKVKFEKKNGKDMAMLSPLRFHYDSDAFNLPVRLGLLNSGGKQDLIVHVLAPNKRYEVSNYPNVTIPTNLDVSESARNEFGSFYATLFDKTVEQNPKAVITEYAWDASTCDPCPGPAMNPAEFMTLGADVLYEGREASGPRIPQVQLGPIDGEEQLSRMMYTLNSPVVSCYQRALEEDAKLVAKLKAVVETDATGDVTKAAVTGEGKLPEKLVTCIKGGIESARVHGAGKKKFTLPISLKSIAQPPSLNFTLTRLHARYGKETLGEDLIFKEAEPIAGGREVMNGGKLEHGSQKASINNFQGRYAIRHPWKGAIACKKPRRGVWGGPPSGQSPQGVKPALDLAFAKRDVALASFLQQDVPELGIRGLGKGLHDLDTLKNPKTPPKAAAPGDSAPYSDSTSKSPEGACQCRAPGGGDETGAGALAALGLLALVTRVLRRKNSGAPR